MKRIGLILFWAVIAAAFIGPGTITTAARAGADFGYTLLWALTFSTLACFLLQEMSARSYLVSGESLGTRIRKRFPAYWLRATLAAAIGIGGIAYEAGNLLGAVAGIRMLFPEANPGHLTKGSVLVLSLLAAVTLWSGRQERIAQLLGIFVVLMGVMFLALATQTPEPVTSWLPALVLPDIPGDSGWLVLGLIGTTIVPYNLFLGGSIGRGQEVKEMRLGLGVAVFLGGLISMAVLVSAVGLDGQFSFESLSTLVADRLGINGAQLLGVGLMAAGFTSAVTAPWATALTIGSLFDIRHASAFRLLWGVVLLAGLSFGVSGLRPVPVIIAAQALNGLALPIVAVLLLLMMNRDMGRYQNSRLANLLGILVVVVCGLLGASQLFKLLTGF